MRPKLCVEVTSIDKPTVSRALHVSGWGADAGQVNVDGRIADICIKKDGKAAIGIYIKDDGTLVVTGYTTTFHIDMGRNVRLENDRPWETEDGTDDEGR